MFNNKEGSTGQLVNLCFWYFFFYVFTGILPRFFRFVGVGDVEYTVWSTMGGNILCLLVVFALGWYKFQSSQYVTYGGITFPKELLYIVPSGFCTAIVIPTTTLLYSLGISVMVAQIIMRGSIIVISRGIDFVQTKQGILTKKVCWEEEVGVLFAIIAVSVQLKYATSEDFNFIHNVPAMIILGSYLVAYTIRIYIMNFYKNTRPKDAIYDYKGFFAIEQIAATLAIFSVGLFLVYGTNSDIKFVQDFKKAIAAPTSYLLVNSNAEVKFETKIVGEGEKAKPQMSKMEFNFPEGKGQKKLVKFGLAPWEVIAGTFFGAVAFFSVFIFMFKGRTATFAGLVNRLTSLIAGTAATLICYFIGLGDYPKPVDWAALVLIFIALSFISLAEKRRYQGKAS